MVDLLVALMVAIYITAAAILLVYGLNCYVMIVLFGRRRRVAARIRGRVRRQFQASEHSADLPMVTTQIAVYNEFNVVERAIRAACAMQYPPGRHEIQVLDDSNDETRALTDSVTAELKAQGHDIQVVRRAHRQGYKAGALANGMQLARGKLLAVFDADFVPPPDYLLQTIPFFMADANLGLVQARWGHLNRTRSLLTRAQSIGIDGHFMVEQAARNWNGLYMNFNGTAGIWRRTAIEAGGGWQWDTLTEDMDLSYRVQFAGWHTVFLPDVVVPAEIPETIAAFKSQQFRWAKGSIQTAKKLLPRLFGSQISGFKKLQAVFHMTHYLVHPLMLTLALLAMPVLLSIEFQVAPAIFSVLALALILAMAAPSTLYVVSQRATYPDWLNRVAWLPFLVCIGVGIAISNSQAVWEAVIGRPSEFVRTPKRGDREIKHYTAASSMTAAAEIVLGLYCLLSLGVYLQAGKYLIGPFLCAYTIGFIMVGLLTVTQAHRG